MMGWSWFYLDLCLVWHHLGPGRRHPYHQNRPDHLIGYLSAQHTSYSVPHPGNTYTFGNGAAPISSPPCMLAQDASPLC
ncbi:hypothetical protein DPEC_G00122440 [Dallia pectoralis]|uniref:Uncharacterized protein n=1 Tax=Dallia pectoralis TaxID=75939 RepID=A0ACC2GQD9_DALPE|nr:hypothetical protein DPEC_G00122440 [Dallia pectoralis]